MSAWLPASSLNPLFLLIVLVVAVLVLAGEWRRRS